MEWTILRGECKTCFAIKQAVNCVVIIGAK